MSDRIVSDHYGARRPSTSSTASGQSSLTPSADARLGRLGVQGGIQFSQRKPHRPVPKVTDAPTMRSDRYGGRALHAAPAAPQPSVDLDEAFGSDEDLNAEVDALLSDDNDN